MVSEIDDDQPSQLPRPTDKAIRTTGLKVAEKHDTPPLSPRSLKLTMRAQQDGERKGKHGLSRDPVWPLFWVLGSNHVLNPRQAIGSLNFHLETAEDAWTTRLAKVSRVRGGLKAS